jgi:hypothetical protein
LDLQELVVLLQFREELVVVAQVLELRQLLVQVLAQQLVQLLVQVLVQQQEQVVPLFVVPLERVEHLYLVQPKLNQYLLKLLVLRVYWF